VWIATSLADDLREGCEIAQVEDATRDAIGMELFEGLRAFPSTEEEHGDSSATCNGERRTASSITIELCQYQAGWIRNRLEPFCNAERLLPRCSVEYKDALPRIHRVAQICKFTHQLVIKRRSSRRVDDQQITPEPFGCFQRTPTDICHWSSNRLTMDRHADRRS
jgi:hypothetical protein